ncbi:MAG: hypothetical protein WC994_00845 [Brumimicrobium sp.]
MKWIGDRISFVDNKDNISFVIYPPKIGWKKIVMLLWFILWIAIGVYMTYQFFRDFSRDEKIVLVVFMSFWTYFAIRVGRTLLYLYYGREFIKLDKDALRIKQSIGQYGKSRKYFIENISKLKLEFPKENSFKKVYEDSSWVMGENRIKFEFFGKEYSFGRKLNEKDADLLFKTITRRIEKFIKLKR